MTKALNLDPGERIILEVRKHWFVFLPAILAFVGGTLLPPIFYLIWNSGLVPEVVHFTLSGNALYLTLFVYTLWVLGLWIAFFLQWTNYYLDVWYVTDKRIIDIDQKGIFHRQISNIRFDKIQDISIEVRGVIATFFNFGDIHVQTASEDSKEFFIRNAADPENAKKIIFSQYHVVSEQNQRVKIVKDGDAGQTTEPLSTPPVA